MINTYNKNYAIRYNGKFDLNKWVSISEDLVWKNTENRSKDTNDAYTGPVLSAIYMPAGKLQALYYIGYLQTGSAPHIAGSIKTVFSSQ